MTDALERRVECISGKLLFRVTIDGIKVWCHYHRKEELYTWAQLAVFKESVIPSHQNTTIVASITIP